MPYSSLGRIIRCLRLRHIDNGSRHRANHHHRALGLPVQQVTSDFASEEVCPIDVHTPQLLHPVWRVCNGVKILGEASGGDEVVDLAMILDDIGDDGLDGLAV